MRRRVKKRRRRRSRPRPKKRSPRTPSTAKRTVRVKDGSTIMKSRVTPPV